MNDASKGYALRAADSEKAKERAAIVCSGAGGPALCSRLTCLPQSSHAGENIPLKAASFFNTPDVVNSMRVLEESDRHRLPLGSASGGDLEGIWEAEVVQEEGSQEEEVTASGTLPELTDMAVDANNAARILVCFMDSRFTWSGE